MFLRKELVQLPDLETVEEILDSTPSMPTSVAIKQAEYQLGIRYHQEQLNLTEKSTLRELVKYKHVHMEENKKVALHAFLKKISKQLWIDYRNLLTKSDPKKRTLALIGSSNAGKSFIARNLTLHTWTTGMIDRMTSTNVHAYSYATTRRTCCLFEEPLFTVDNVETMKLIMGGEPMMLNPKHMTPYVAQNKAFVVITAEYPPWNRYPSKAFENRAYIHNFTEECVLNGVITKDEFWTALFEIYSLL